MELIDISRDRFHNQTHRPVAIAARPEKNAAGEPPVGSKALALRVRGQAGPPQGDTPLDKFSTPAICLDLSHVPLKHAVTVPEMEDALAGSGEEIRPGDTVLIYMATNKRLLGRPGYQHDFPGLAPASVHWLADRGIGLFGVEAISPAPEGELSFEVHKACEERDILHMECLTSLHKLVGRGRFLFIGLPLTVRGSTASPTRALAIFQ
jgi:kynurenine formamidase